MKIFDKIGLVLFSCLIFFLSFIMCLIIFGWIDIITIIGMFRTILTNATISNIILGVCIVCMLLAIKCIFFESKSKIEKLNTEGILLANDNGKLVITKETLENLVSNIAKGFESTQNVITRIYIDKDSNVIVNVVLYVLPTAVIKDLTNNIQSRIKEVVKKATDIDIKEVNIEVKNITPVAKTEVQ